MSVFLLLLVAALLWLGNSQECVQAACAWQDCTLAHAWWVTPYGPALRYFTDSSKSTSSSHAFGGGFAVLSPVDSGTFTTTGTQVYQVQYTNAVGGYACTPPPGGPIWIPIVLFYGGTISSEGYISRNIC